MKKIVALLLFPMLAHAQPGPMTQYLTHERATLLDVGMMRLETLVNDFERRVGVSWEDNGNGNFFRPSIHTSYEPNVDKIYVYFFAADSKPTEQQMAEGCKNAFAQMRIWLMKSLPDLFLHTGFGDPAVPADAREAMKKMVEMKCYFSSDRDSSEGRFWASQKLTDAEMTIGKW
jgi:hypothetical protein